MWCVVVEVGWEGEGYEGRKEKMSWKLRSEGWRRRREAQERENRFMKLLRTQWLPDLEGERVGVVHPIHAKQVKLG